MGINAAKREKRSALGKLVACLDARDGRKSGANMDDISNLEPPMPGKFLIPSLLAMLLAADPAFAHTGVGTVFSFSSGFQHPLGGLDHLLAMFAVGLLAAQLGGNAVWFVPGAFVAMMIAGALIGLVGFEVPGVEQGITISVVAIALPVAFALGMPAGLAMVYVGFFALFHGYAHGAELPVDADAASYVGGFTLATAIIHAAGVSAGLGIGWVDVLRRNHALRVAGAVLAFAGIGLVTVDFSKCTNVMHRRCGSLNIRRLPIF